MGTPSISDCTLYFSNTCAFVFASSYSRYNTLSFAPLPGLFLYHFICFGFISQMNHDRVHLEATWDPHFLANKFICLVCTRVLMSFNTSPNIPDYWGKLFFCLFKEDQTIWFVCSRHHNMMVWRAPYFDSWNTLFLAFSKAEYLFPPIIGCNVSYRC